MTVTSIDATQRSIIQWFRPKGVRAVAAVLDGKERHSEWLNFRDGRTDSDIATAVGSPAVTGWITDLRLAYKAMDEIYEFATNVASPAQGDRLDAFRKYT